MRKNRNQILLHAAAVVRVVTGWLVLLLAFGLWQGYGAWLLGEQHAG